MVMLNILFIPWVFMQHWPTAHNRGTWWCNTEAETSLILMKSLPDFATETECRECLQAATHLVVVSSLKGFHTFSGSFIFKRLSMKGAVFNLRFFQIQFNRLSNLRGCPMACMVDFVLFYTSVHIQWIQCRFVHKINRRCHLAAD